MQLLKKEKDELKIEKGLLPSFLRGDRRLLFFGGKGGVGKTTASAATALLLSEFYQDKKILYLSLDPAHSIADSLDKTIRHQEDKIFPNLWAAEVDSNILYLKFIEENKEYLKILASRGTYFDSTDIERFFKLSIPGIDEVMGIFYLTRLLEEKKYDILVVDTAPTGHTLRLLSLPEMMQRWVAVFDSMQEKYRYIKSRFSGSYTPDEADRFLEKTLAQLIFFKKVLTDRSQSEFIPVTIAEPMALLETERLITKLNSDQISVFNIIINRLSPHNCSYCFRRRQTEEANLRSYENRWEKYNFLRIPLLANEVRGENSLYQFGQKIITQEVKRQGLIPLTQFDWPSLKPQFRGAKLFDKETKLVMFSGKGGVGKTSMAAATAIYLVQRLPEKKIFIFSTDPAHSLSDSFSQFVGERENLINPFKNLYGQEINAEELFKEFKTKYKGEIEDLFHNFLSGNLELRFDREIMEGLIDLCPPGVDELMALSRILELMEKDKYDLFILDSAPTGHFLRLLQTPDIVRNWLKAIFELLLKYKGLIRLGKLAESLLKLSKDMRHLKELLADEKKTKVLVITIPEAMGVLETKDLIGSLEELKIEPSAMVVNNLIPELSCQFCQQRRNTQETYLKSIKKLLPRGCFLGTIPQFPGSLEGEGLKELSRILYY